MPAAPAMYEPEGDGGEAALRAAVMRNLARGVVKKRRGTPGFDDVAPTARPRSLTRRPISSMVLPMQPAGKAAVGVGNGARRR